MLGYSAAELAGRRLIDFAHPDERSPEAMRPKSDSMCPPVCMNGEMLSAEGRPGSQGTGLRVPLRDTIGKLRFIVTVILDITEQRQVENKLRHSQKMETLGTLVGGIAHDFNNQLTIILGNLRLVLANFPKSVQGHTELSDAELAGQRCADMTRGLLTFQSAAASASSARSTSITWSLNRSA